MKASLKYSLIAAAGLTCVSSSHAAAVAYEGFDYTAGNWDATSKDGGTGAWTSNWTTGTSGTNLESGSLTYGSLETSGGKIVTNTGNNRFGGSRGINLAGAGLLANDSELWFSALLGYDAGGNRTNATMMLMLGDESMAGGNFNYSYSTAGATGLGVFVGRSQGTGQNGVIQAAQVRDSTFGTALGNPVYGTAGGSGENVFPVANTSRDYTLVVGRITWGASSDIVDIFLPGTDLSLGSVHSTLTVNVDQSGFDNVSFKWGDAMVMDELRFGGSFADVTPIPEPSSVMLVGLSGLALLRRRR